MFFRKEVELMRLLDDMLLRREIGVRGHECPNSKYDYVICDSCYASTDGHFANETYRLDKVKEHKSDCRLVRLQNIVNDYFSRKS